MRFIFLFLMSCVAGCGMSEQHLQSFWEMDTRLVELQALEIEQVEANWKQFYGTIAFYYWEEEDAIRGLFEDSRRQIRRGLDALKGVRQRLLQIANPQGVSSEHIRPAYYNQIGLTDQVLDGSERLGVQLEQELSALYPSIAQRFEQLLTKKGILRYDSAQTAFYLQQFQQTLIRVLPNQWTATQEMGWIQKHVRAMPVVEAACLFSEWRMALIRLDQAILTKLNQHFRYGMHCPVWSYCSVASTNDYLHEGEDFEATISVGLYRESLCAKTSQIIVIEGKDTLHADENGIVHYQTVRHKPGKYTLDFYFHENNTQTGRAHDWGRRMWMFHVITCPTE